MEFKDVSGNEDKLTVSQTSLFGSLGFQRNFTTDKLLFFVGFDVKTNASILGQKIEEEHVSIYNPASNHIAEEKYSIKRTQYGAGPLLGLQYQFFPRLSVGLESSVDFFLNLEKYSFTDNDPGTTYISNKNSSSGYNLKFAPLSFLSVNYHF